MEMMKTFFEYQSPDFSSRAAADDVFVEICDGAMDRFAGILFLKCNVINDDLLDYYFSSHFQGPREKNDVKKCVATAKKGNKMN